MKTILVTGAGGQLGSEIKAISEQQSNETYRYIFCSSKDLDITNETQLKAFFQKQKINVVVNCAAYTKVDKAETEINLANKVNVEGVQLLAQVAQEQEAALIHISTDFVFDGSKGTPYKETDKTSPIGVYGKTKLAGEEMALKFNNKSLVIRTSWLYSSFGHNFVKTMLRLGRERSHLGVVYDQVGSPTYARDLAQAIHHILQQLPSIQWGETYHFANQGVASWYDFAVAIMKTANLSCAVQPIETKDYPTPAQRPVYSVLSTKKIKDNFQLSIPHWQDALERCLLIRD